MKEEKVKEYVIERGRINDISIQTKDKNGVMARKGATMYDLKNGKQVVFDKYLSFPGELRYHAKQGTSGRFLMLEGVETVTVIGIETPEGVKIHLDRREAERYASASVGKLIGEASLFSVVTLVGAAIVAFIVVGAFMGAEKLHLFYNWYAVIAGLGFLSLGHRCIKLFPDYTMCRSQKLTELLERYGFNA